MSDRMQAEASTSPAAAQDKMPHRGWFVVGVIAVQVLVVFIVWLVNYAQFLVLTRK